jgi:hypothetical protein
MMAIAIIGDVGPCSYTGSDSRGPNGMTRRCGENWRYIGGEGLQASVEVNRDMARRLARDIEVHS